MNVSADMAWDQIRTGDGGERDASDFFKLSHVEICLVFNNFTRISLKVDCSRVATGRETCKILHVAISGFDGIVASEYALTRNKLLSKKLVPHWTAWKCTGYH